ncbi:MAG TPA: mechanosensitive ion channel family protein, partial [Coriobacteriia bacterium]|nr:mechanosensitive ion channel family protein [Coriobacteriia bacterium]
GIAVGLALQPTLENIFSGIQVLASRQIEPGDLIRLETGEEGAVLDVTWRNTTIVTPSNDLIIVPNAIIGRSRITNFSSLSGEHVLVVPFVVSASADTAIVEQCVREIAEQVASTAEGVVAQAEPTVRFAAVTPTGMQVNAGIRVHSYPDRIPVRHEFIKRLLPRLHAEGIETAAGAPAVPGAPGGPATSPAR